MVAKRTDAQFKAWSRYRTATRNLNGFRYDEMEPWAWARLEQDLAYIGQLKKKELAHA